MNKQQAERMLLRSEVAALRQLCLQAADLIEEIYGFCDDQECIICDPVRKFVAKLRETTIDRVEQKYGEPELWALIYLSEEQIREVVRCSRDVVYFIEKYCYLEEK